MTTPAAKERSLFSLATLCLLAGLLLAPEADAARTSTPGLAPDLSTPPLPVHRALETPPAEPRLELDLASDPALGLSQTRNRVSAKFSSLRDGISSALVAETQPVSFDLATQSRRGHLLFQGRDWHADLGLYHYRARWYDPDLGSFLEPDPLGPVDSPNLYQGLGWDGYDVFDPMGLADEEFLYWRNRIEQLSEVEQVVLCQLDLETPSSNTAVLVFCTQLRTSHPDRFERIDRRYEDRAARRDADRYSVLSTTMETTASDYLRLRRRLIETAGDYGERIADKAIPTAETDPHRLQVAQITGQQDTYSGEGGATLRDRGNSESRELARTGAESLAEVSVNAAEGKAVEAVVAVSAFAVISSSRTMSPFLRAKMRRIRNAVAARGNRGISGTVSYDEAMRLGAEWVGDDAILISSGKGWISMDGRRQFRFPDTKIGIDPMTGQPFSTTGVQVNFQYRPPDQKPRVSNVHLDVEL